MIRPFLIGALVAGCAPFSAPAAHACPPRDFNFPCRDGAVAVSGDGTIDPGLPCPASGCDVDLSFTAAFVGTTANCTFDGRDTHPGGATVLAGSGAGSISCSGGFTASGTVTFARNGNVVRVSGAITVDSSSCAVDVTLSFVPGGPPPVTTFSVHGGGTVTC